MLQYPGCGVSCVAKVASLRAIGTDFLSHLLCSSPKRRRRPPFCTVCTASRAGRTDTQVFNALCFRAVTESLVARCPRPCATLHTPMDNEPAPFLKWIFPRSKWPLALCAPSAVSCPLRRCLLGLTKRSGLGLPNEKASHFHFYSSRLAFNLDKIGCGSAEQR